MKKIVLIGAGSSQFGYGTVGEIFSAQALAASEVVLLDINPDALRIVEQTARKFVDEKNLPTQISGTTDREVALQGADFVIISIEVGDRFELWDQDRTVPQQYGIRQVYGENGGPGGLFHALRIIPPILEICEDVKRICPDAWVFNYSNPMSRICTTVQRALPEVKFVGLCHEVSSLERYLPAMLETEFSNLQLTAGGLNHFSCLIDAKFRDSGRDAYPDIRSKAADFFRKLPGASDFLTQYRKTGRLVETEGVTEMDQSVKESAHQFVERGLFMFVLEHFGLLPITTDSHFGEYPSWAYDVVDHRGILDFYQYYRHCMEQVKPSIKLETHERVVPIMEALTTNKPLEEAAVNLPNAGLIPGLPPEIAVEVPALIDASGVRGQPLKNIPTPFLALLQNQVGVHMMTAEAVLSKSKKAVVQAMLCDPIVTNGSCVPELVEVMVGLQSQYLGYLE